MPLYNGVFKQKRSARQSKIAANILGTKPAESGEIVKHRKEYLAEVDKCLVNAQYDHLPTWDATDALGNPLPVRKRKPRIIYNLGKRVVDTVASKLLGPRVFPEIKLDEDINTREFANTIINVTKLKSKMIGVGRSIAKHGSAFLRFKFSEGKLIVEKYNTNYCYPKFDSSGELESIEIKYVYCDKEDKDERGRPKNKWFKLEMTKDADILYDNPVASHESEPTFQVVNRADHQLGFVLGTWFKVGDDKHDVDGPSLVHEIKGFIDAFNYSISQSDQAVSYNQEPQLLLKNMDEDEMEGLIKSSQSAWNLGRDGEASYLESGLGGVSSAGELRMKFREGAGDITRVILLDPEKTIGSAQSAKAMEVMYAPLLDLIDEYRPFIEDGLINFIQKMMAAVLILDKQGLEVVGLNIPKEYVPITFNLTLQWPEVFPKTMQDLQQKVSVASQAAQGNLVSRETLTRWLAKDFGIEDIEEEIQKIAEQPVINPFGF